MAEYEGQGQKPAGSPGGIETSGLVAAASPHWGRDRQGWAGKQIITCFPPSDYEVETADIKSRLLSLSLLLLLRRHWPLIRGLSKLVQFSSPNDCDSRTVLAWN